MGHRGIVHPLSGEQVNGGTTWNEGRQNTPAMATSSTGEDEAKDDRSAGSSPSHSSDDVRSTVIGSASTCFSAGSEAVTSCTGSLPTSFPPLTQVTLASTGESCLFADLGCSIQLAQGTASPTSHDTNSGNIEAPSISITADNDSGASVVSAGEAELTLDDFECSTMETEQNGRLVSIPVVVKIRGKALAKTTYKELRRLCSRLGVKSYKNKSKNKLLELLAHKKRNNGVYDPIFDGKMMERNEPTTKQIQCPFRLMNVMFSDQFVAQFIALGDQRSRADLDAPVSMESKYWAEVHLAFVDDTPFAEFDHLIAEHAELDPSVINPAVIVRHSVAKLRKIWGATHTAFMKAYVRFTTSGTNDSDFYRFCDGRLDALYLRMHSMKREGLTVAINRSLPNDVFLESTAEEHHGAAVEPRKKNDVADAIRTLGNHRAAMELRRQEADERKMRFLEEKEARQMEKEAQQIEFRQQQLKREDRSAALRDYTFISDRLMSLYSKQETVSNQRILDEIEDEVCILQAKKRKLAEEL